VRSFLAEHLGFGDFVFRMPDGKEVARARDLREFVDCLASVPAESLRYHAGHNHISNWLLARSEFDLAARLRPQKVSDFPSIEKVREYLIDELTKLRRSELRGLVTDFSLTHFDPESRFQKIGDGMLGGKGRGLAFLNHFLPEVAPDGRLAGVPVRIPQTFVLATGFFEKFLAKNRLRRPPQEEQDDEKITKRFLDAKLPAELKKSLKVIIEHMNGPLAVRSSSLLEDDMLHPFAGVYETRMLANDAKDPDYRLTELCQAIKLVYASTFFRNARAYHEQTSKNTEEERMAVVIQGLVGQRFGSRFYPHISGVAQSYNFYPVPPMKAEQGVVALALGLGRLVVDGGQCLRFCPRYPSAIPQLATPAQALKSSQNIFYALDMKRHRKRTSCPQDRVRSYPLEAAAEDGTLQLVASRYDASEEAIKDGPAAQGPPVVTFNNILKYGTIPLAAALDELLKITAKAMGTAVEIEFALDMKRHRKRTSCPQDRVRS
ncbi:MAG: histidine kinase, partial [Deltaproteobacteria bacterium]